MGEATPHFLERLDALPVGYSEGLHDGRRYGVTVSASPDGRRGWLYAEELGGADRVSCNVYRLGGGGGGGRAVLRPCEMPEERVVDFVLGFVPFALRD